MPANHSAQPTAHWPACILLHLMVLTSIRALVYSRQLQLPPLDVGGFFAQAALWGLACWGLLLWCLPLVALPLIPGRARKLRRALAQIGLLVLSLYVTVDCISLSLGGIPLDYFIGFIPELITAPQQARTAVGNSSKMLFPVLGLLLSWGLCSGLLWWLSRRFLRPKIATVGLILAGCLAVFSQMGWRNPSQELNAHLKLGFDRGYLGGIGYWLRSHLPVPPSLILDYTPAPPGKCLISIAAGPDFRVGFDGHPPTKVPASSSLRIAECSVPENVNWARIELRDEAGRCVDQQAVKVKESVHLKGSRFSPEMRAAFEPLDQSVTRYWQRKSGNLQTPLLPSESVKANPPHVIVVIVESLRQDSFRPETMPELSKLAEQGLVLKNHSAATNSSHLALFAVLSGRSPLVYFFAVQEKLRTFLPAQLKALGYRTGYWGSTPQRGWKMLEAFIHPSAFDVIAAPKELMTNFWEVPARDRHITTGLPKVLEQARRPEFVFVWLNSTHFPYGYPPEFERHHPAGSDVVTFDNIFTLERQVIENRYKNSVAFIDHELAKMVKSLDLSKTLVVITGDHGESLGEYGVYSHGTRVSDVQVQVPCILFGPGVPAREYQEATSHLDLGATLIGLVCQPGKVAAQIDEARDLLRKEQPERILTITPFQTGTPYEQVFQWRGIRLLCHLDCRNFLARSDLGPNQRQVKVRVIGILGSDGNPNFSQMPDPDEWKEFQELLERL